MKRIKIIDLLNMISRGEEVPKKIKYKDFEYIYAKEIGWYRRIDDIGIYYEWFINKNRLNDIVEIIEQQEEIDIQELEDVNLFDNGQNFNDMPIIIKSYDDNFTNINNTINKLVQAVKQLDLKINK